MKLSNFEVLNAPPRAQAERFVEILTGDRHARMHFVAEVGGRFTEYIGTLDEHWDELFRINNQLNANIFVVVQASNGVGRTGEDIVAGRAVIAESDRGALVDAPFEPTLLCNSKAGPHFWAVENPTASPWDADAATRKTRGAVYNAGTDPAIATKARIMRMPGFFHMKDPKNPHMVTLSLPADGAIKYYDSLDEIDVPDVSDDAWLAYHLHYSATGYMAKIPGCDPLQSYKDAGAWIENPSSRASVAAWVNLAQFCLSRQRETESFVHAMDAAGEADAAKGSDELLHAITPVPFSAAISKAEWDDMRLWTEFAWQCAFYAPAAAVTIHRAGGRTTPEWAEHREKAKIWVHRVKVFRRESARAERAGEPSPVPPEGFDPATITAEHVRQHVREERRRQTAEPTLGVHTTCDLTRFLNDYGLATGDTAGAKIYASCPFADENHPHRPQGACFWRPADGKPPSFHCFHTACQGLHWQDVVRFYGADAISRYCAPQPADTEVQETQAAPDGLTPLESTLPNTPWPELLVPEPWKVTQDGVFLSDKDGNWGLVAHSPLIIAGFARPNDHRSEEYVKLAWWRGDRWIERIVPRAAITDSRTLGTLANYGCPVHSRNEKPLVAYLADFEAANLMIAKTEFVTRHLGWQEGGDFLVGDKVVQPDGKIVSSGKEGAIRLVGDEATGDLHLALSTSGTAEGWLAAAHQAAAFAPAAFAIYASLASPLLEVLDASNVAVEWAGPTSGGKTTVLRLGASVWGSTEIREGATLLRSWDNTPVALERLCAAQTDLPAILDDTQRWSRKPDDLSKAVYSVTNGIGRGRGDKVGMRETTRWRTVLMSSGERPLSSFAPGNGGDKARILTLWGSPFPGAADVARAAVTAINNETAVNFGWAGPEFVSYLQRNRDKWPAWRDEYREECRRLGNLVADNQVAVRQATAFMLIRMAAKIAHEALGLNWDWQAVCDAVWRQIVGEVDGSDPAKEALVLAYDHAVANERQFYRDGNTIEMSKLGLLGKIDVDGTIWYIGTSLKQLLAANGYPADATIRTWRDRGWIDAATDGRGKSTRLGSAGPARCYGLLRKAVQDLVVDLTPADEARPRRLRDVTALARYRDENPGGRTGQQSAMSPEAPATNGDDDKATAEKAAH